MKRPALLDVNVLVSLFDPAHPHHKAAHTWFGQNRSRGWATCAVTQMGCVRVLGNPRYPTVQATVEQVVSHLRMLCAATDHEFWDDSVMLTDETQIDPARIPGHLGITDTYLLALAVHREGRLVTFDRAIVANSAAVGANKDHVVLLEL